MGQSLGSPVASPQASLTEPYQGAFQEWREGEGAYWRLGALLRGAVQVASALS
jgi:hypothetical protein